MDKPGPKVIAEAAPAWTQKTMGGECPGSYLARECKDSSLPGWGLEWEGKGGVALRMLGQTQPKVTLCTLLHSLFQSKCERGVLAIVYLFHECKLNDLVH